MDMIPLKHSPGISDLLLSLLLDVWIVVAFAPKASRKHIDDNFSESNDLFANSPLACSILNSYSYLSPCFHPEI